MLAAVSEEAASDPLPEAIIGSELVGSQVSVEGRNFLIRFKRTFKKAIPSRIHVISFGRKKTLLLSYQTLSCDLTFLTQILTETYCWVDTYLGIIGSTGILYIY